MIRSGDPGEPEEEWEEQQEDQPEHDSVGYRESIWTIPTKLKRWYFALFSIQVAMAVTWLVKTAIEEQSTEGAPDILFYIWQYMAPAAVSSAALALVLVDGVNFIMVLSSWLAETLEKHRRQEEQRRREEDKQRRREEDILHRQEISAAADFARVEATAEVQKRWEEWNSRREAAVAAGEEFGEPPPGVAQESEGK